MTLSLRVERLQSSFAAVFSSWLALVPNIRRASSTWKPVSKPRSRPELCAAPSRSDCGRIRREQARGVLHLSARPRLSGRNRFGARKHPLRPFHHRNVDHLSLEFHRAGSLGKYSIIGGDHPPRLL